MSIIKYKVKNIKGITKTNGVNVLNVKDRFAGMNIDKNAVVKEMYFLFVNFFDIRNTGITSKDAIIDENIFAAISNVIKGVNVSNI